MLRIYYDTKKNLEKMGFFKVSPKEFSTLSDLNQILYSLSDFRSDIDSINDLVLKSQDNIAHAMQLTIEKVLSSQKLDHLIPSKEEVKNTYSKFIFGGATDGEQDFMHLRRDA